MRYLDVTLDLPKNPKRDITVIFLKNHVMRNVKKLFGQKGSESEVDIIKYDKLKRRFIIRCKSDNYVRLRAALTLASDYEGEPCVYIVHRATANILSLAVDSRSFVH